MPNLGQIFQAKGHGVGCRACIRLNFVLCKVPVPMMAYGSTISRNHSSIRVKINLGQILTLQCSHLTPVRLPFTVLAINTKGLNGKNQLLREFLHLGMYCFYFIKEIKASSSNTTPLSPPAKSSFNGKKTISSIT